jgi:uncharacterized protein RhaS with RHS repeats
MAPPKRGATPPGISGPTAYTNQVGNVTQYAYDTAGRKTNEVQVGVFTNRFTYTPAGNLANVAYPSGNPTITNWFDALNRFTQRLDGLGTTVYTYAMLGNGQHTVTETGPWASDDVTLATANVMLLSSKP